ncbi:MAG TPA: septum site-determining protein MinC [Chloroflexia bacterium]|nr:septum site-determining protein MinC [Chloroflexia bacterium]
MQVSDAVIIKGVREGLLLILDDDVSFSQILTSLVERIKAQPNFFKGAGVIINAGHRVIDRPEFDVLYRMLTRNEMRVQTFVSLSAQSRMVAESYGVASRPPSFAAGDAGAHVGLKGRGSTATAPLSGDMLPDGLSEVGTGLFLRCNLHASQSVRYSGDVCVLGDVEPGAEIIADGDVVIWGVLRGYVHAGVGGDDEAVVCALQMAPSQLGIGGLVSRFPNSDAPPRPELARLISGRIVVEAWQGEPPA